MPKDDFNIWSDLFGVPDLDYDGYVDEIDDSMEEDLDDFDQKRICSDIDDLDDVDDLDGDIYLNTREGRVTQPFSTDTQKPHASEARNLISNEHLRKEDAPKEVSEKAVLLLVSIVFSIGGSLFIGFACYITAADDDFFLMLVTGLILLPLGILLFCYYYSKYIKVQNNSKTNPPAEESQDEKESNNEKTN